jgi:hypothetical protein
MRDKETDMLALRTSRPKPPNVSARRSASARAAPRRASVGAVLPVKQPEKPGALRAEGHFVRLSWDAGLQSFVGEAGAA